MQVAEPTLSQAQQLSALHARLRALGGSSQHGPGAFDQTHIAAEQALGARLAQERNVFVRRAN